MLGAAAPLEVGDNWAFLCEAAALCDLCFQLPRISLFPFSIILHYISKFQIHIFPIYVCFYMSNFQFSSSSIYGCCMRLLPATKYYLSIFIMQIWDNHKSTASWHWGHRIIHVSISYFSIFCIFYGCNLCLQPHIYHLCISMIMQIWDNHEWTGSWHFYVSKTVTQIIRNIYVRTKRILLRIKTKAGSQSGNYLLDVSPVMWPPNHLQCTSSAVPLIGKR